MPEDGDGGVVRNTGMGTQLTGQASLQLLWDSADEFLDLCSLLLFEPAEDNKTRFTLCELAINLPMPAEIWAPSLWRMNSAVVAQCLHAVHLSSETENDKGDKYHCSSQTHSH